MNATKLKRYNALVAALHASESQRGEHEEAWNDYQRLYANGNGVLPGGRQTSTTPRNVNLSFQTVEIMTAAAMEIHPKIYARPRKKEAIRRGRLAEKALDFWESTNYTSVQVEEAHRDAAIYGDGFLKTAWVREHSRRVEPDPIELQQMLEKRDELEQRLGAVLSDRDVYEYLRDQTVQVVQNRPLTRRVSIWDIWLDMQAKDYRDIAWIAHRYSRPLQAVRDDPGFRFKQRKNAGAMQLGDDHGRAFSRTILDGLPMVDVIEIWDLAEEQLYVADYSQLGSASALLYDGDFPYAIGQPFTNVPFYKLPDQLYSMGAIELIAPLQQELNDIREEQTAARGRMRQKFAAVDGLLSEEAIAALQSDIEGDVVMIDPEMLERYGTRLGDVLVPLQGLGVNAELYNQTGLVQSDVYNVTGVTEYQRGLVSNYRSATEVNTVNQFTSARLGRMIRNVQQARLSVARKEIGLAAQFMDTPEVMRIVGHDEDLMSLPGSFQDGRNTLFPFDRKDIAGEYDLTLEPGSADPESKQMRIDRLQQVIAMAAQFPELNRPEAIKQLFSELGFSDPASFISPVPTPIQAAGSQPGGGVPAPGGGRPGGSASAERQGGLALAG